MRAKAFQELAATLKDARDAAVAGTTGQHRAHLERVFASLTRSVASVCERQSPKFDRERFIRESGLSG